MRPTDERCGLAPVLAGHAPRSEEFFEIDPAAALGVGGVQQQGFDDAPPPEHALRLFLLLFGRAAFLPQDRDDAGRSCHAFALNGARLYEEKVSHDLGERVFTEIFPQLADAPARGDLHASRHEAGYSRFKRAVQRRLSGSICAKPR